VVKKLEKGTTAPKVSSQHQSKKIHHKKDEKIEYARTYLNARMSHIKSGIGYKIGDTHNSRVNTKGQEFIKFPKANMCQDKEQAIKPTNNASFSYKYNANTSHISYMSYHDFNASYVGPHHKRSKTCVWVPKCLVTKLRGLN
jgi:hypothetical protein